eukprot:TRINITY_DN91415_c0_g1_i1.p1 TRINITY_DN91415_c0_g1~~TRINITY_DN91415_c0_g1_i1.p1  ORF type:complete len:494 (-),score=131.45 TRINITY_DN91415_c0_g1_i1:412-1836(-)
MARLTLLLLLSSIAALSFARDSSDFLAASTDEVLFKDTHELDAEDAELVTTRVSYKSYGNKVSDAMGQFIAGIVLVCLAFPVVWYNEKRQVHMDQLFAYATKVCRPNKTADSIEQDNENHLVHMQGTTSVSEQLRDEYFPVVVENCAKLKRTVEMYQWVEHKKEEKKDTSGGGEETITTYTYSKEWSVIQYDSSGFVESGHDNPPFPFESTDKTAQEVAFGAFSLSRKLVAQMQKWTPVKCAEKQVNAKGMPFVQKGDGEFANFDGQPDIGDLKVTFTKVECGDATVMAVQQGNSFVPLDYSQVPQGCCGGQASEKDPLADPLLDSNSKTSAPPTGPCGCVGALIESGEEICSLREDKVSARVVMDALKAQQSCIHYLLMLLGCFMFIMGFYLQFTFVPTLFRIIPWAGVWIEAFGKYVAILGALFVGCCCFCTTLGFSWLASRPIRGIIFLAFAGAVMAVPTMLAREDEKKFH